MKRWLNIASQITLGAGQIYTLMEPAIPDSKKPFVMGGIATAQLIVSILSHNSNPDGTPASVAYVSADQK